MFPVPGPTSNTTSVERRAAYQERRKEAEGIYKKRRVKKGREGNGIGRGRKEERREEREGWRGEKR